MKRRYAVYIAGPQVFLPQPEQFYEEARSICIELDLVALCPYAPNLKSAQDIWQHNITLLRSADAMVVDVSPFRGVDMDVGSAWESGFMHAFSKPIVNYSFDNRTLLQRTKDHFGIDSHAPHFNHLKGLMPDGMSVESFEYMNNLMSASAAIQHIHGDLRQALIALKEHPMFQMTEC